MAYYKLTGIEALAKLRSGELTVETYARSLLSRIEQRDAAVGAWSYLDREQVLAQARELDAIPPAQRGPLHGLPVGVKDILYTKDMPTTFNSPIYRTTPTPQVDAGPVAILRARGALIFGKTTTTEFAAVFDGTTRNPHDPRRTPGGSSAGSAAAVADFQVPVALGSQTAGSVVRPASFTGVWGLKFTWAAVAREGQRTHSLILDTPGVFARCVGDLDLLAGVLGVRDDDDGDDYQDAGESVQGVQGLRFAVTRTPAWSEKAGPGTVAALEKAVSLLRAAGATVDELDLPPAFDHLLAWHQTIMIADGRTSLLPEYVLAKEKLAPPLRGFVETPNTTSSTSSLATTSTSTSTSTKLSAPVVVTNAEYLAALDGTAALRPAIDALAAPYAAVLAPSVPDEAPLGTHTGDPVFNSPWTALHVPVVNLPGFRGPAAGMPVGVSLVAPRFRDRRLLRVAGRVGRVFEADEAAWAWKGSV